MNEALVALDGVTKRFEGDVQALAGVDLRVAAGEFVTLLGPSGCGKSTLLRLVAGLDRASSGTVDAPALRNDAADTAFVFQDATLMPWARVADNVRLPLRLAGESRAQSAPRVARALASVGLAEFAQAFPNQLGSMPFRVERNSTTCHCLRALAIHCLPRSYRVSDAWLARTARAAGA